MGRELKNLTFEQWVKYVFDHPVKKKAWHWDINRDWWNEGANSAQTLSYLTRLFTNSHKVLAPYTHAQIKQGLWFLVDNSCSDHMFAILDEKLPVDARKQCVEAMSFMYELVFARQCAVHLSHLDKEKAGGNPLNMVCYMWWDIIPIHGQPDNPARIEIDKASLNVMEKALSLNSIACQESALHGLGHWFFEYPRRVQQIIEAFLEANLNCQSELRDYAKRAWYGNIL